MFVLNKSQCACFTYYKNVAKVRDIGLLVLEEYENLTVAQSGFIQRCRLRDHSVKKTVASRLGRPPSSTCHISETFSPALLRDQTAREPTTDVGGLNTSLSALTYT